MSNKLALFFVFILLITVIAVFFSAAEAEKPLVFISFSDIQVGYPSKDAYNNTSTDRFALLVEKLNSIKGDFDFAVNTGDLVCGNGSTMWQWKLFADVLADVEFELYHVKGNHDGIDYDYFTEYTGNEVNYYFDRMGIRFIFIGYEETVTTDLPAQMVLSKSQQEWILTHSNYSKVWIFSHAPVLSHNKASSYWVPEGFFAKIQNNVIGITSGHQESAYTSRWEGYVDLNELSICPSENSLTYEIIPFNKVYIYTDKVKVELYDAYTMKLQETSEFMFNSKLSENLDSIRLESPYFETANAYKGQLHCHTKNSDGAQSPLETVTAYKNAGYDFIAITDHNYVTPDPEVGGILFITGNEVTNDFGDITTTNVPAVPPNHTDAQATINWTKMQGGLAWLAHPNDIDKPWTFEEMAELIGYNGIEVFNPNNYLVNADEKWDYILTELDRITAIAVDDCHDVSTGINRGWVMVFADSLTKSEILTSLEKGNFYSTKGPIINAVKVEGNTIRIKLNQTSLITWIGAGGSILREAIGVEDTYVVRGTEKYVRIRVGNSVHAWTNPVYIGKLNDVRSASVSDSRVNPSQLITLSGQVYYENATSPSANGSMMQAYVDLNGANKAVLNVTESDGAFTFPTFPAESSVGLYNYNVYTVWNGQVSAQNQTVPVIVDGLKVSNYTINMPNDQVQVHLLYAYDNTAVQNGNATYAGLFALTNANGWATFNLSPLRTVDWGLTAYAISEPTYCLTAKLQNQTTSYAKTTIENFIIKANNPIINASWNNVTRELSFESAGTIVTDVGDLGKPTRIEMDGAMCTGWIYNSTARQVTVHDIHGRIVLQWRSYSAELWVIAACSVGVTIVSGAIFLKKRR